MPTTDPRPDAPTHAEAGPKTARRGAWASLVDEVRTAYHLFSLTPPRRPFPAEPHDVNGVKFGNRLSFSRGMEVVGQEPEFPDVQICVRAGEKANASNGFPQAGTEYQFWNGRMAGGRIDFHKSLWRDIVGHYFHRHGKGRPYKGRKNAYVWHGKKAMIIVELLQEHDCVQVSYLQPALWRHIHRTLIRAQIRGDARPDPRNARRTH